MSYRGTVIEGRLELDEPIALTSGTRVEIGVAPEATLRKGSPKAALRMAGTLSEEDANALLQSAQECRQIDRGMWLSEP